MSAHIRLSIDKDVGLLQLSLSESGVEQALKKRYQVSDLTTFNSQEFKELLVDYIKENIVLIANGKRLVIANGGIKLGNHQTDLKLTIKDIPLQLESLDVKITCFQENDGHQNILKVEYGGMQTNIRLTKSNQYQSSLAINENSIQVDLAEAEPHNHYLWYAYSLAALLIVLSFVFLFRHRISFLAVQNR